MKNYILLVLIVIIIISYFLYFTYETELKDYDTRLGKDGFLCFNKHLQKRDILKNLPKGYVFLDYKYEIKGCTLSTYHRDVTSSQYIFNSKYPIYTYICYFNSGKVLSLCPQSHKQVPFLFTPPKIINIQSNRPSVLFNCDIVHAGYLNKKPNENRHAIQYKIIHKDDLVLMKHLDNINKITQEDCKSFSYYYETMLRKSSVFFSFIINHCFTKYLQNNQNDTISNITLWLTNKNFFNR